MTPVVAEPPLASRADYDPVALFYHQHWCGHFHEAAFAALDRVLLHSLPVGAHVLDVCCGTGTISRALHERGFQVTGLDLSAEMLCHARRQAPNARFFQADARYFQLPARFDAALSTFDSLNHLLTHGDLLAAFRNVRAALRQGGRFVFDLNLEEAYLTQWHGSFTVVEEESACFLRGSYDPERQLGSTQITVFHRQDEWQRADVTIQQRCYSPEQVTQGLHEAGFRSVQQHDAIDLGMAAPKGIGRAFFVAE